MAELLKQIKRILHSHELTYVERDDELDLRFDSAVVRISVAMAGGQRLIHLRSTVLAEIPPDVPDGELTAEANRLNADHLFGKWVFYSEHRALCLEYDCLGDHLQQAELMTALASIARQADSEDDRLRGTFGGRRAVDQFAVQSSVDFATGEFEEIGSDYVTRTNDSEWLFLALLAMHMTKAEIGSRLGMSKSEVNDELGRLCQKYGPVAKRGDLVAEAKARSFL